MAGVIYPTIAISDLFMAACHYWAFWQLITSGHEPQAFGFLLVAFACSWGVLRFGFSESAFKGLNEDFAQLAGRVGLPLVGSTLLPQLNLGLGLLATPFATLVALFAGHTVCARMGPKPKELVQTLLNLFFFVLPIGALANKYEDTQLAGGLSLFLVAGLVIGPDRQRLLFGIRRENLFHYGLGISTLVIASRLAALLRSV